MSSLRKSLVVALLVLPLALSACAPAPATNTTAPVATSAAEIEQLVVALPSSLSTLDPTHEAGTYNYAVAAIVQEGLVTFDEDGAFIPALATRWKQDGLKWVYEIRQDATFWDGTPVTVEDILFSIDIATDGETAPSTSLYWPADLKVEKTGDWEITFTLPAASAGFPWTPSSAAGLFVTSKAFYESHKEYGGASDLILGTGAYKVTEFAPDSHLTLERYDGYWGEKPKVKTLRIDFVPDANTRLLAFQKGEIDLAVSVPLNQLDTWSQSAGAEVKTVSDRSYQGLTFDGGVEPFDDIHVRKAVAYSVDSAAIVSGILKDHGSVAYGIPSPGQLAPSLGGDEAAALAKLKSLPQLAYSVENAKAELAQSKVPDGFSTTLTYPESDQNLGKASLAIAEELKKIGIQVKVKEQPLETWVAEVGNGEQGVGWMSYIPTTGDPNEITGWLLSGDGNPANWVNKEVAEYNVQAGALDDATARIDAILKGNGIAQEQAIYRPVYWGQQATAFGPKVTPTAFTSYFYVANWAQLLAGKA